MVLSRDLHFCCVDLIPVTVPVSFKYGAEALAMVGIAYGLIKWVGRSLRSLISDTPREQSHLEALGAALPAAGADSLVRQGIVSRKQLEGMTPRERAFLIATAGSRLGRSRPNASATPASGVRPQAATPTAARPAVPAAPRLHLITPSRPPLGVAVHCPGCGTSLDREALQRLGDTSCARCKRQVSAHIQRGRLTVIVEETTEEAEYRRRMEGGS